MAPLKIGILGAARIADDGIVTPSRVLGHRVVAVAARDRSRAEAFAAQRGIEKVHQTYAEVIDDPEVEVVYNALVNSLHAQWNQYALKAGKHVLSEKPFASNATEASLVRDIARTAPGQIVEGFHYLHHPVNQRLRELVTSGELGDVRQVDIQLTMSAPPTSDPRWSLELAGGATMDLGCYVLHAARQLGRWLDQAPSVVSAEATLKEPEVDSAMSVEVAYPGGVRGRLRWDMTPQAARWSGRSSERQAQLLCRLLRCRRWTIGSSSLGTAAPKSRLLATRRRTHTSSPPWRTRCRPVRSS
jgi:predicted dehydrogenase